MSHAPSTFRIGTASWTLPKQHAATFSAEGTHLERYSAVFNCVEINSSFHRPHMRKPWVIFDNTALGHAIALSLRQMFGL